MSYTDLSTFWTIFHNPRVLEHICQRKAFRGIVLKELMGSFSTDELK